MAEEVYKLILKRDMLMRTDNNSNSYILLDTCRYVERLKMKNNANSLMAALCASSLNDTLLKLITFFKTIIL